jgi:hypothetical protein
MFLRDKRNNSRKNRENTREERDDSRENIKQKKIRILKELVVFWKKKYIELSQQNNVWENYLNSASQKRNRFSQNFEFIQKNSRRNYNANETIYRIKYINKWNSINLKSNFKLMNRVCEHYNALHWISKRKLFNFCENLKWKSCCKKNDVILFSLRNSSQLLRKLLTERNLREFDFRQNIRFYNFAFIFIFVNYKTNSRIANRLNNDREFVVF